MIVFICGPLWKSVLTERAIHPVSGGGGGGGGKEEKNHTVKAIDLKVNSIYWLHYRH